MIERSITDLGACNSRGRSIRLRAGWHAAFAAAALRGADLVRFGTPLHKHAFTGRVASPRSCTRANEGSGTVVPCQLGWYNTSNRSGQPAAVPSIIAACSMQLTAREQRPPC